LDLGCIFLSNKGFVTTVTELVAIANLARIGSQPNTPNPKIGTNVPSATGIKPILYTNVQNKFCIIFETVLFPKSSSVTTYLLYHNILTII
jgi:hypothetical protein